MKCANCDNQSCNSVEGAIFIDENNDVSVLDGIRYAVITISMRLCDECLQEYVKDKPVWCMDNTDMYNRHLGITDDEVNNNE